MFLLSCSKKIFIDTYHFDNIEKYLDKEVVFKYSERFESFVFLKAFWILRHFVVMICCVLTY